MIEFGHIVGQDHDGSAGIPPSLAPHVSRRIQQGARNVRASAKSFRAQHIVQFALHRRPVAAERQPYPAAAVEDHDRHPIRRSQHPHGIVGGRSDPLNVGTHAGADVEQQQHVDRHLLAGEIPDLLRAAFFPQHEIPNAKALDGAIVPIQHLRIHAHQRDIAAEHHGLVSRSRKQKPGARQRCKQH